MIGYIRKFEGNTTMCNEIWKRVEKLLKIEFDSKPVYGEKTKKQKYTTLAQLQIFKAKKVPKEKAPCMCLSIIMLDSVIKTKKKILSSNTFGRKQM